MSDDQAREKCPNSKDGEHNYDNYDDPFGLYCRNCDFKEKYGEYCNTDDHKNLSTQLSAYREALVELRRDLKFAAGTTGYPTVVRNYLNCALSKIDSALGTEGK